MAIIYYPSAAGVITRQVSGGQLTEQFIDVTPNQVIVLSGSIVGNAIDFVTASYAGTASVALQGGASVLEVQIFS